MTARKKPAVVVTVRSKEKPTRMQQLLQQLQDAPIPEDLDPSKMKQLTPGRVSAYQKKLFACLAPLLELGYHLSIMEGLAKGSEKAQELYAKQTGKISTGPGLQVTTNVKTNSDNNNDNRSIQVHGVRSVDQIARELEAGRKAVIAAPLPTPVREKPESEDEEE
jgi:hypothetical protein